MKDLAAASEVPGCGSGRARCSWPAALAGLLVWVLLQGCVRPPLMPESPADAEVVPDRSTGQVTPDSAASQLAADDPVKQPCCDPGRCPLPLPRICDGDPPPGLDPIGEITLFQRRPGGILVQGWALDPDDDTSAISVRVILEPGPAVLGVINAASPHPGHGSHGFDAFLPLSQNGSRICVTAINEGAGLDAVIGCHWVQTTPFGWIDSVAATDVGLEVKGWAIDPDVADPVLVRVNYADGASTGEAIANLARGDVGAAHQGYGDLHGFELLIPTSPEPNTTPGVHTVCMYAMNVGAGSYPFSPLGCKETLRIATFNFDGPAVQRLFDDQPERGWAALRGYGGLLQLADIAVITEVRKFKGFDNDAWLRILVESSSLPYYTPSVVDYDNVHLANSAILSQFPLRDVARIPSARGCERCGQLVTAIASVNGMDHRIIGSHYPLDTRRWIRMSRWRPGLPCRNR